jgi:hypothetical protein
VQCSDNYCKGYDGIGDVPGLHMSIDIFCLLGGGEGRGDQSLKEREAGRPRAGCTTGCTSLFRNGYNLCGGGDSDQDGSMEVDFH